MTLYLLIGSAIFIIGVLVLRWCGKQPAKHRINVGQGEFRKYLEVLLNRGYDRGFMIIEAPDGERFIQFSKYIDDKQRIGLQCDFPNAPWSVQYFEAFKSLLSERAYHYDIQQVDPSPHYKLHNQVSEFIVVDLKQDLERASELCKLGLQDVFKLSESDIAIIWFMGVSVFNEKVMSIDRYRKRTR